MSEKTRFTTDAWLKHLDGIAVDCRKENWDSYHADAVTDAALNATLALGLSLMVSPTNDGGVQISFAGESLAFEVGPDGRVNNVYADLNEAEGFIRKAERVYGS